MGFKNMYNIKTMNKISSAGMVHFPSNEFNVGDEIQNPDAIIVRSASLHEMEVPQSLKAVARAGAGVNNIPVDKFSEAGIVVFNTPGANANAVKEMVIAGLLLSSRKIVDSISWAKALKGQGAEVSKLVEKGKGQFTGPEISGKRLGVIGLGAIGVMVANVALNLGMEVLGFDPYISVDAAWGLSRSIKRAVGIKEIFETCDYITVHVPLNADTKGMFNTEVFATMKDDVRILNFSRGELVVSDNIIKAIKDGKVASYVTDFPTDDQLDVDGIIAIPHLGASTPESEDNCASMAANQLVKFLKTGNIKNSVNFPDVELPSGTGTRVCVIHKNIPNMISQISAGFASENINIENLLNKSRKEYAYTLLDVTGDASNSSIEKICTIEGVIRVWKI
jgi:D-3-phosphoglycerate dehydrogenase